MNFRKCPKCEINYIKEDESFCDVCRGAQPEIKQVSVLNEGEICGDNAQKIYQQCCQSFGWDSKKACKFSQQQRLCADDCDSQGNAVWFITYSNLTPNKRKMSNELFMNEIQDNGRKILEQINHQFEREQREKWANRIVFARDESKMGMYVFLGVYQNTVNELKKREYDRISDHYPY